MKKVKDVKQQDLKEHTIYEIGKDGFTEVADKSVSIDDLIRDPENVGKTYSFPTKDGDTYIKVFTGIADKANSAIILVVVGIKITHQRPFRYEVCEMKVVVPHARDMELTVIGGFNCVPLKFNAKIDNFTVVSEPWMPKLVGDAYSTVNRNLWRASEKSLEDSWDLVTGEILSGIPTQAHAAIRSYISEMGLSRHEELDKLRGFADHFGPVLAKAVWKK